MTTKHMQLARRVADLFAERLEVEAVALSGSLQGSLTDSDSDIDLYVFTRADIPVEVRTEIKERSGGAVPREHGFEFLGSGR